MASVVQLCNMALSHIGSDARVTSINPPDGSVEAGHCATFYDLARTEMLEPGSWAFSLKRTTLAQRTNASDAWAYAYTKPSDCMRALRILRPTMGVTVFNQDTVTAHIDDRDSAQFEIEGDVIYSNEPSAVLVYVQDVTDSTKFPPSFASALSYLLAGYLVGPIVVKTSSGPRLMGDLLRQQARTVAEMSAAASANASSAETSIQPTIVAVRT